MERMKMPRAIKTVEDFVRLFNEFLDEEDPMTPEEVDAELREAGYDPQEVGARMRAVAERTLAEWRTSNGHAIVRRNADTTGRTTAGAQGRGDGLGAGAGGD